MEKKNILFFKIERGKEKKKEQLGSKKKHMHCIESCTWLTEH